jgi:cell wall-associated NlpC family hydrolase
MFGHELPQNIYDELRLKPRLYINQDAGRPRVSEEINDKTCAVVLHKPDDQILSITDEDREEMNALKIPFVYIGSTRDISEAYLPDRFTEHHGYLNRPFLHGVFDCYSLIHDMYLREFGLWLPANVQRTYGWWDHGDNHYLETAPRYGFEPVQEMARFDMIIMKFGPVPNHAAVYLGDNKILHHVGGRFSTIEELTRAYKQKIAVVYRNRFVSEKMLAEADHPIEGEDG